MNKDTMNIKEWADKKSAEIIESIKFYISEGIEKRQAVKMGLEGSILGAGYRAQIKHEFGLTIFDKL